jgi:hypothetical protein
LPANGAMVLMLSAISYMTSHPLNPITAAITTPAALLAYQQRWVADTSPVKV